jgi:hypothetical protein
MKIIYCILSSRVLGVDVNNVSDIVNKFNSSGKKLKKMSISNPESFSLDIVSDIRDFYFVQRHFCYEIILNAFNIAQREEHPNSQVSSDFLTSLFSTIQLPTG